MKKKLPITFLLGAAATLVLQGCGSSPTLHHFALPGPNVDPAIVAGSTVNRLKVRLEVPDYLHSRRMVLATENNERFTTQYHRWVEPLSTAIKAQLTHLLSNSSVGQYNGMLSVSVSEFHGDMDGITRLSAQWRYKSDEFPSHSASECLTEGQFQKQLIQAEDGYAAMVEAHGQLLLQLADSVKDAVKNSCE